MKFIIGVLYKSRRMGVSFAKMDSFRVTIVAMQRQQCTMCVLFG
jgi:hypothetical protein